MNEKTNSSTMPITNGGTETETSSAAETSRRAQAARPAVATARTRASATPIAEAAAVSRTVGHTCSARISPTPRCRRYERPRSPWSSRPR
ncbi:hypothetical protein [Thermobispora bispora]|uniref:hypothetical protein n=1 Tax=Thermobispora bispora TaxID=2006 RepID=UPI00333E55F0